MDLQTQEKVSNLLREQAIKLGRALRALKRVVGLSDTATAKEAKAVASEALREISDYGKHPQDL